MISFLHSHLDQVEPVEGGLEIYPRSEGVDPYKHFCEKETEEDVLCYFYRRERIKSTEMKYKFPSHLETE